MFTLNPISFEATQQFSPAFLDFLRGESKLKPFYTSHGNPEDYGIQLERKTNTFPDERREILADVLLTQYQHLADIPKTQIESLRKKTTFTVTTGHQLNLATGPLYFHLKIITVIKTAAFLNEAFPDYNFIPVYWMATEDHDFEEISKFRLFNKVHQWETAQTGAVGRMDTSGLADWLAESTGEELRTVSTAYREEKNLANATRRIVHELYGKEGLLIIDADDSKLKAQFTPVLEADLFSHIPHKEVSAQSEALEALGYKAPAYVRPINLFYLKDGLRERIERREDGTFEVLNSEITFSEEALKAELEKFPERFSPNVILRPLYQEWILPNLSYTGGPTELIYWLQLGKLFTHFQVPFPILLPRHFAMVLQPSLEKKVKKLNLSFQDLFLATRDLQSLYVERQEDEPFSIEDEKQKLREVYEEIIQKTESVDASLKKFVASEREKHLKLLEKTEKRIKKAEERKHDTALGQIERLQERLFPDDSLQERKENFLNFYQNDENFIQDLLQTLPAFDKRFFILTQAS